MVRHADDKSTPAAPPALPTQRPTIGITMGDPAGIGAEVIVKALADRNLRNQARFVIYGMNELIAYAADLAEIDVYWHRLQHDAARAEFDLVHDVVVLDYDEYSMLGTAVHRATKPGGAASIRFLDDALAAALRGVEGAAGKVNGQTKHNDQNRSATSRGASSSSRDESIENVSRLDAIVTAPICKESWKLAGVRYPGHTEFLQHRTKSKRSVMMFQSPKLNVALATVHLPLMDIRNRFTIGTVFDPIDLGAEAMKKLGVARPRIAVCGLNPHASENGQFGDEEARVITPAIDMARGHGIDAHGPFPADTIFLDAAAGKYDLVVAMYHDQGLIPVKLLNFDEAVNVTLGLPIIRTSVDHGTAFDIVGKNVANAGSMKAAIRLAVQMANAKAQA